MQTTGTNGELAGCDSWSCNHVVRIPYLGVLVNIVGMDYSLTSSGCLSMMESSFADAPSGRRRPCSHCPTVEREMPSEVAKSAWLRPRLRRSFAMSLLTSGLSA